MSDKPIRMRALFCTFPGRISLTWFLTLCEAASMALIPLFMSFAIDGLLEDRTDELWLLGVVLFALVALSVGRRAYDTRVFGAVRVHVGLLQSQNSRATSISALNARLSMGRELADFLENEIPDGAMAFVQLAISIIVLFSFDAFLAAAAAITFALILLIYVLFHKRFYNLNGELNHQTEMQIDILTLRKRLALRSHLLYLRRTEVKISDAESLLYGAIFLVLFGMIMFNLWYATTTLAVSVGAIFAILSYSWEFVESALAAPMTLQSWSRLKEITIRINEN
ncbi:ABC transporter six-transmembrane domain-containing protein [uncultured Maritalea sp.]|uniref:ABC transporter six-transmembrane domain-containing protein n=1 Tax=uncultured Maritalea sp. TaxID=757249 RepID=UPI002605284E|nr:ABC transporter six-transmembrane domain-containing protein [uncultured Maritalea sp.]